MSLYIAPRPTTGLDDLPVRRYDALLCSLGYETRSRTVAEGLGGDFQLHALGFTHSHVEAYRENRAKLVEMGAEVAEMNDEGFGEWVGGWFAETPHRHVAVDISSMSRPRIAATVQALRRCPNPDVIVDFLYVPQKRPRRRLRAIDATTSLGPVLPDLAGWAADVDQPLMVLFGLGYEPIRAAGAIDELDPYLAIPFFPKGPNSKFIKDVTNANTDVFELSVVSDTRDYQLDNPFACFVELDSLISVYAEREGYRSLLLPLGPKIFALVCILVSVVRDPPTPVWRISPGPLGEQLDRQPEDMVVSLRVSPGPIDVTPPGCAEPAD